MYRESPYSSLRLRLFFAMPGLPVGVDDIDDVAVVTVAKVAGG